MGDIGGVGKVDNSKRHCSLLTHHNLPGWNLVSSSEAHAGRAPIRGSCLLVKKGKPLTAGRRAAAAVSRVLGEGDMMTADDNEHW